MKDISKLSFWFMTDFHTFIKPEGETLDEIVNSFKKIAKDNPWGMVCPVRIIKHGKEEKFGECCHVDGNGDVNMDKWIEAVKAMKDIKDKPDFEFEAVSYANEWELNNWGDVKGKKLVDRSFRAGLKHAERIQKELERLQKNYDLQQGVLDSYRKRVEELEKLLKLERESNPNKAPF